MASGERDWTEEFGKTTPITGLKNIGFDRGKNSVSPGKAAATATGPKAVDNPTNQQKPVNRVERQLKGSLHRQRLYQGTPGTTGP